MIAYDDDTRAERVHVMIERALGVLAWSRKLPRPDALGAMLAHCNGASNPAVAHAVDTIIEQFGITHADLADHVQAFIDLDAEEEAERARETIAKVLAEANA